MGWIEQNGGEKEMGFIRQAEARGFPGASKADDGVVGAHKVGAISSEL